jgi:dethiobiotin synthetase
VPRPGRLVVVSGTGTEVGKTWVAARLIESFRAAGLRVAARKPLQSFAPGDPLTDAEMLAAASGEDAAVVCPPGRRYAIAMAPPMAGDALGAPVPTIEGLVSELEDSWPEAGVDVAVVEGVGGVASPLAADGDTADLARVLGSDVVIVVAEAGLGAINSGRLSVHHLAPMPTVVHLNRFDPGSDLHVANARWLVEHDGFKVTTEIGALEAALLAP